MPSARPVSHEDIWPLSRLQVLYTDEPYHTVGSDLQSAGVGLVAIRLYSLGRSGEDVNCPSHITDNIENVCPKQRVDNLPDRLCLLVLIMMSVQLTYESNPEHVSIVVRGRRRSSTWSPALAHDKRKSRP
jgi:hypothetical protein